MNLSFLRKSAQAVKEIEKLSELEFAVLNMAFTQFFFNPWESRNYFLFNLFINAQPVDFLLARFCGALCVLAFDVDDPVVLILKANLDEIHKMMVRPSDNVGEEPAGFADLN